MKRPHDSPQSYIDSVSGAQRELLDHLRALVSEAAPEAVEGIRYGMLDYPDLCSLAAQKHFVALYVDPAVVDGFRDRLGDVDCGKSCLRFKRLDQVPDEVIVEILRARASR